MTAMEEATVPTESSPKPARRRGPPLPVIAIALVAAIAGTAYYIYSRGFEDTDDAQIDGDIASISPRVAGTLKSVSVVENQSVKAGDVLAEIDPADFQVSVAAARAMVAQAEAQLRAEDPSVPILQASNVASARAAFSDRAAAEAALSGSRKDVAQLTAQVAQAEANYHTAQNDVDRSTQLYKEGAIPKAQFDAQSNGAVAAAANVEALKQALAAAQDRIRGAEARLGATESRLVEVTSNAPRQVETRRASVVARQAQLELARAQLQQAENNVSYTKILAPSDGIVGKKSVSVGDRVAPGQQLMAIANTSRLWVTANFRETQLQRLRTGLPVEVHVDAIDADLHGTVESIGGATGARYSILPPENASGNYVKVVQRVPVRIRLEPGQAGLERLRPGLSVEPKVKLQ